MGRDGALRLGEERFEGRRTGRRCWLWATRTTGIRGLEEPGSYKSKRSQDGDGKVVELCKKRVDAGHGHVLLMP